MEIILRDIEIIYPDKPSEKGDIVIQKGSLYDICAPGKAPKGKKEIDCRGLTAFPGVIDMHAHLREPGQNPENIESGTRAAVAGGITTVVAMPNTRPPCDSAAVYEAICKMAGSTGHCPVIQAFSGSRGLKGRELSDFPGIDALKAVSDDGISVEDTGLLREILRFCREKDLVYLSHPEDLSLRRDGVIHEGTTAKRLGLPGIPGAVEDIRTYRDAAVGALEKARLHFCHVSTEESLEIIKHFKKRSPLISCEVTPHHFTLSEEEIPGDDALYKMSPPLRAKTDREALIKGLADGSVDVIATDHAPHAMKDKSLGFLKAPFGITGFETLIPLSIEILHHRYQLPLSRLATLLSANPARILKMNGRGNIRIGDEAWLTVIDIHAKKSLTPDSLKTKGKNTPFTGRELRGVPRFTVIKGEVYDVERDLWL